ncbi:MAG: flippase-like domain-containing protein [Candidatus Omnitrophica bacterium]|nr:flippase-like domain-containing protein [Candidatus Omnitrophota bacterium]
MLKKFNSLFLRVAISILSLAFVYYSVRGEVVEGFSHLKNALILPLLIALLLNFISLAVVTFRISKILSIQHLHLSFSRLYYLWVISLFFNLFLPSAIGGDIAKAYYIYKDTGKKMASAISILIDRFFGLMATVSIGFLAFLIGRRHIEDPRIGQTLLWMGGLVLVGILFFVSRRFSKRIRFLLLGLSPRRFHEKLQKLFEAFDLYRRRRKDFGVVYLYSILAQVLFIFMVYFIATSIDIHLPIAIFFLFMPLILIVSMIPSIGGLGVREAATVYLFKTYIPLDQAVAFTLIFDLFLYGIGCACGILYAIRGGASIKELEQIEN